MGKLSGTESISTRSSGDFTTTKSIPQFPITKKKDRNLSRESTDTTLSRRSSLPPVASPGRTYVRGSETSTRDYRLHSEELYMGRQSFPVCKIHFNWPMVCKIRFNWPMVCKTRFNTLPRLRQTFIYHASWTKVTRGCGYLLVKKRLTNLTSAYL